MTKKLLVEIRFSQVGNLFFDITFERGGSSEFIFLLKLTLNTGESSP
jgi:hypothetical protein